MSASDLSGRFIGPRTGRPWRPLSKRASTASWSIRFSLRMMISGAFSSMSFLSRLFRLMTRRYRSLRSDVANRPPSSGTSGRRSGGMTGMTLKIIHSGRLWLFRNASMMRKFLAMRFCACSSFWRCRSLWRVRAIWPKSRVASRSWTASAPIFAVKLLP